MTTHDVQLVKTLERRFLPYALDIVDTSFSKEDDHMAVVMELLRSRHAQHVSFRGCTSSCSHWLRQESFMYLRLHLPGGCTDDNQVPAANVESDTSQVREFADKLLNEWLLPCRVCCHSSLRHFRELFRFTGYYTLNVLQQLKEHPCSWTSKFLFLVVSLQFCMTMHCVTASIV